MNSETLHLKTIINELDFFLKKQNVQKKDLILLTTIFIERLPDPTNAKEYHNSFLKRKIQDLRQGEKVFEARSGKSSNSSLYSYPKKVKML